MKQSQDALDSTAAKSRKKDVKFIFLLIAFVIYLYIGLTVVINYSKLVNFAYFAFFGCLLLWWLMTLLKTPVEFNEIDGDHS